MNMLELLQLSRFKNKHTSDDALQIVQVGFGFEDSVAFFIFSHVDLTVVRPDVVIVEF